MYEPLAAAAGTPSAASTEERRALTQADWNVGQRIGFRFTLLFALLSYHDVLVQLIPGADSIDYDHFLNPFFSWVAATVFGVKVPAGGLIGPNGSGDTTFNYIEFFIYLCLAVLGTVVWSACARARSSPRLHEGLRILLRYCLGLTMLEYGLAKVIPTQFATPSLTRLLQPLGAFSPMGVLWTFMGSSIPYTIFSGVLEAMGGLLLFFRRTTTVGALIACAVLTNVVALNFCYDVPVKLYSSLYLASALFLLAPELRSLADVLVFHRPTFPKSLSFPWRQRWIRTLRMVLKPLLVAAALYFAGKSSLDTWRGYIAAPPPALYGIYAVEEFQRNGAVLPPLTTDGSRWRRFVVDRFQTQIRWMDDVTKSYRMKVDVPHRGLTLIEGGTDPKRQKVYPFAYSLPDPQHLQIRGRYQDSEIVAKLRREDLSKFLLTNRGFHWINEYPFNR